MLHCRSFILALLWQMISVDGGFASVRHRDDWNNWIILPARSRTSDGSGDLNSFSSFRVNDSNFVHSYLDPGRMEPYIMTISGKSDIEKDHHTTVEEDVDDNSSDDLIVPLGRAIEKVKDFCAIVKELFSEDYNLEIEGRASSSSSSSAPTSSTRKIKKLKKYKKFLLPLLLAYKLKFLTLIPMLIGGLILLVGTTGLAGFFFALFTAVMSLKSDSKVEIKKW